LNCILPVKFKSLLQRDFQAFDERITACLLTINSRYFLNPANPPLSSLLSYCCICIRHFNNSFARNIRNSIQPIVSNLHLSCTDPECGHDSFRRGRPARSLARASTCVHPAAGNALCCLPSISPRMFFSICRSADSSSRFLREVTGKNTNIVWHAINPVKKKSW